MITAQKVTEADIKKLVDDNLIDFYCDIEDGEELLLEYNDCGRIRMIVHLWDFNSNEELYNAMELMIERFDFSYTLEFDSYEKVQEFFNM